MLANKPRGLSLNKNAVNINDEPLPPTFKTLARNKVGELEAPSELQSSAVSRIPRLSLKFPAPLVQLKGAQLNVPPPLAEETDENAHQGPLLLRIERKQPPKLPEPEEEEIEDIDKSLSRDAMFLVCDVAKDVYEYMYELEQSQSVRHDYLKDQKILTPKVRQRLVNWCIEIHSQLQLLAETLYMTIAVIDRYFDRVTVKHQSQVQLVAVGAVLIASKYEEIYPPDVGDLMHLTQNSYSRREIMKIEIEILEQLNFDLGRPIPLAFLRRFSRAAHCDQKMHSIAKYLMELSLTEYECSHWRPSMLAAAALFATVHLVHQDNSPTGGLKLRLQSSAQDRWNKTLVHYTHYSRKELQEPAATLCKILKRAQKNPQSFYSNKKNSANLLKWPELKSPRVDTLIKLGDQVSIL